MESEDAWNNNYNAPSASINTILSTDGTYGAIMGAISVNSLWSSNSDYSYPSIITNNHNNLRLKGNINLQYSGAVQISCGSVMSLSLIDTGKILGSGDVNYITRTDLSTQYPYSPNPPIGTFKNFFENQIKSFNISLGSSIILLNTGKVLTVGVDAYGILGTGTIGTDATNIETSPVAVNTTGGYNGSNVVAVSSTSTSSLILLNTGKVLGFGTNDFGQLGNGTGGNFGDYGASPAAVSTTVDYNGSNAIAITAGERHSMILLNTGKVLSFGSNSFGKLGDGTTINRTSPIAVSTASNVGYDGSNAIAVATGYNHSLILLNTGKVLSFGSNTYGRLGDGTNNPRTLPVAVDSQNSDYDGSNAIEIAAGEQHSMILLNTGKVLSFGYNLYGQLGDNSTTNRLIPVEVDSQNNSFYDGSMQLQFLVTISNNFIKYRKVLSFGYNLYGQLGGTIADKSLHVKMAGTGMIMVKPIELVWMSNHQFY